jgi:hypothetical protein
MNPQQVASLLDYLQDGYQFPYRPEQTGVIGEWLMQKDYAKARRACDVALDTTKGQSPPTRADLCKAWADVVQEGVANAPGQSATAPVDRDAITYQDKLIDMPDDEYMALLAQRRREA